MSSVGADGSLPLTLPDGFRTFRVPRSTHSAEWVSRTLGGHLPVSASHPVPVPGSFPKSPYAGPWGALRGDAGVSLVVPTRVPATLIAPVPCVRTFCVTVPVSGFRATTMGSWEGFSAVPKPAHVAASSAAGAAPALSIALDTLSDFGNPEPYIQCRLSRISNPASSIAHTIR